MRADGQSDVHFRVAAPDDWEPVRRIRLAALTAEPQCFGHALTQDQALTEVDWRESLAVNRWILAEAETEIVGLVALFLADTYPDGAPQLGSMWVAPRMRRRGLARELEREIAALAMSLGFARLGLWITEGNSAAASAYEALGYASSGDRKPAPRDDSVLMHRWLRTLVVPAFEPRAIRGDSDGPARSPGAPRP